MSLRYHKHKLSKSDIHILPQSQSSLESSPSQRVPAACMGGQKFIIKVAVDFAGLEALKLINMQLIFKGG